MQQSTSNEEETPVMFCSETPGPHTRLCGCGCVPSTIPSLFEMAEKRRKFKEQQALKQKLEEEEKSKQLTADQSTSIPIDEKTYNQTHEVQSKNDL